MSDTHSDTHTEAPRAAAAPPPRKHHGARAVVSSLFRDDITKEFSTTRVLWWLLVLAFFVMVAVEIDITLTLLHATDGKARVVSHIPNAVWTAWWSAFGAISFAIGLPKFGAFWNAGGAAVAGALATATASTAQLIDARLPHNKTDNEVGP